MPQTSFALMTTLGRAKEAAALANATTIEITHIAIGDGTTVPSGGETELYHEVERFTISGAGTVVGASNVAYFDCFLAADDGPYTIREAGLIDDDGDLIAIARYDPPISKPIPASGQTVEGTIRLEVAFSDIANVTIKVDPAMKVSLQRLTRLPWIPVIDIALASPPVTPTVGDAYLIAAGATGAWSGQSGKIAEYTVAGWAIIDPPDGHGIGLPDGRIFVREAGTYVELTATETHEGVVWLATEDEVKGADGSGVVRAEHLVHYTRTLTGPLTLYVRPDGNDANDGLTNTSGGALATIQGAVDRAFLHGPGPYAVTIHVANGTYGPVSTPTRPGPALIIIGDTATPANVTIANAAGHAFAIYGPNTAAVSGIKTTTTTASDRGGFISYSPSTLTLDQCETGPCTGGAIHALGGQVSVSAHKYSGGAQVLLLANVGGTIFPSGVHAVSAAITVSGAVANASGGGNIRVSASSPLSFTGGSNVTGKRYSATLNGIIDTLGGGASFFPGTIAGTTATGGQYA